MEIALTKEEEKNKRIAAIISVVLHAIIVLLLFYILAWRPAGEPAQEIGIEVNFGTDAVGSGDVQSQATPNVSKNVQDSKPAPTQPDPEPEPQPKPTVAAASPPTPVESPKVVTTTAEAPVAMKEEPKPQPKPQPQPKEVVKKEEVKPKEEPKKEPEKPRALYPGKPTESTGTGKAGTSDNATGNNNGDDANKVGDKGDPRGVMTAKNYSGNPGGGAGGLDMPGWRYDIDPKRDPYQNETGFVKFSIKIDGDGNITNISTIEKTVSPHVERWYREQLQKTTFSRTGNSSSNAGASGVVTFVIRAQ
ncbi:hypothetical protein [Pontibacter sp. SGAir0037]|uniref:hypothetical protein n=1 Tax=Pontibacter sp. SGAir0037 TaxID=2571030 RepID=UPI0010CD18A8|nr:hypothetical protein [Pontibacter sp. SGAir0037]QCR21857.1 hypothetical protein C1N53_05575 [Pontibacter sp. SGAir0037]